MRPSNLVLGIMISTLWVVFIVALVLSYQDTTLNKYNIDCITKVATDFCMLHNCKFESATSRSIKMRSYATGDYINADILSDDLIKCKVRK